MNKAFIDTTILTDTLIKSGEAKRTADEALSKFVVTELPVFAIKEFKAGPLKNFIWMHNKLVITGSFKGALEALQRMSRTPRRYTTSTAIEALQEASGSIRHNLADLIEKYGPNASLDKVQCDEFRLSLKTKIIMAWKRRRKVTTDVVFPLTCYREAPPYEKRGLIEIEPKKCNPSGECSLASILRDRADELKKMREAIKDSDKNENRRRSKSLRQIYRTPKLAIQERECLNLGDAIFVLFCPNDSVILTTNISDYRPLAQALGKSVKTPSEVLE